MIYHFQGRSYLYNRDFMKSLRYKETKLPTDKLTVVTATNKDTIGLLLPQLRKSNIEYINLVPQGCEWDNTMKIPYILEALDEVQTEYVLILDAFDVILDQDNNDIIDRFLLFNKQLVYNATKNNHPKMQIDTIENRESLGPFKYFNAGCCVGYTSYAKVFYQKCLELKNVIDPTKSEQLIIRKAFDTEQENICIDNECKIFQTVGNCDTKFEDGKWIIT